MACTDDNFKINGQRRDGIGVGTPDISARCHGTATADASHATRNRPLLLVPRTVSSKATSIGFRVALLVVFLLLGTGCSSFSNGKLLKQLQSDNERLLSEFRAERTRREEAERSALQLEQRLAESEKLLARHSGMPIPQRISSLQSGSRLPSSSGSSAPGIGATPSSSAANSDVNSDDSYQSFQWQRRFK